MSDYSPSTIIRNIGISCLVLFGSSVVGIILLVVVALIPQKVLFTNARNSTRILCDEGIGSDVFGLRGSYLDIFTDGLMLNTAYYSAGNVKDTLLGVRISGDTEDPLLPLHYYFEGSTDEIRTTVYTRYWNGYLVYLRPLLCLGNIITIRAFNMVLQISLVMLVLFLLVNKGERKRNSLAVPFIVMWLSLSPVAIWSSLQYYSVFYPTILAMIAILLFKNTSFYKVWYVFLVTGILIGYLDLLTYPIVSLGVPLILYLSLDYNSKKTLFKRIIECVSFSISWCLGYSGMLITRWLVASIVSGNNIFQEGINQILYRTSHEYLGVKYTWFGTIKENVSDLSNQLVVFAITFGIIIFFANIKKCRKRISVPAIVVLLLVCLYPFLWYLVVMQHSNMHHFMTYRNLCVTIYGIISLLYVHLDFEKGMKRHDRKKE